MSTAREVPLTAAELLILRDPNTVHPLTALEALRLTLAELLAWRVLELRRSVGGRLQPDLIVPAVRRLPLDLPHLNSVFDLVANAAPPEQGVTLVQIMRQAIEAFGVDMKRFQTDCVRAALVGRGMVELRNERVLLLFGSTRYRLTPAGQQAVTRLRSQLAQASTLPRLIQRDRSQALALALSLGGVALLIDQLVPHYADIAEELNRSGQGSVAGEGYFWISRAAEIGRLTTAFKRLSNGAHDGSDSDSYTSDNTWGSTDSRWGSGGGDSGSWGASGGSDSGSDSGWGSENGDSGSWSDSGSSGSSSDSSSGSSSDSSSDSSSGSSSDSSSDSSSSSD